VKDAVYGCHFADYNELDQTVCSVLLIRGREFYNTSIQRLTQRWKKCVENDEDFVENSLIIEKVE
jgi:hypothetical protein